MDFGLYQSILRQLGRAEVIRLNYSGESIHYPHLIQAIEAAKATGAYTELVSAFSSCPRSQLRELARSGLDRLSVSLHTMDPGEYERIYGFGSLEGLKARVAALREAGEGSGPKIDFAFVAMARNLDQLGAVAAYARQLGVRDISVLPVIKRDPIECAFAAELNPDHSLRDEFLQSVQRTVSRAAGDEPDLHITLCFPAGGAQLPPGALIRTCDQNPWETAHILSNGDMVVCETHDRLPMGNLKGQPLAEVWQGPAYREFRRAYLKGEHRACRGCAWKTAYIPGPLRPEISAEETFSPQLLRGWYPRNAGAALWSRRESRIVLRRPARGRSVEIEGLLPPSGSTTPNVLEVRCAGCRLGSVTNPSTELYEFNVSFDLPEGCSDVLRIDLATRAEFRPANHGLNDDARNLGFALGFVKVRPRKQAPLASRTARARWLLLMPFWLGFAALDVACGALAHPLPGAGAPPHADWDRGVSIIIPERGNPALLRECLESAYRAAAALDEPCEVIVVVNGSAPEAYAEIERTFRPLRWLYFAGPLSFSAAVREGLNAARYDWVYLLNNDMVMDEAALREAMDCRRPGVFAVASQIFFKSPARMRGESNWTDFCLHEGVVELLERMPGEDQAPRPGFYAGGGSSLFRKTVLSEMVRRKSPYDPFYWEDVEWGAAARGKGYEVIFCPASRVWHEHRATISRFFSSAEIARIFERNGYIFQLRNLTGTGSLRNVFRRIAAAGWRTTLEVLRPGCMIGMARARAAHILTVTTSSKME